MSDYSYDFAEGFDLRQLRERQQRLLLEAQDLVNSRIAALPDPVMAQVASFGGSTSAAGQIILFTAAAGLVLDRVDIYRPASVTVLGIDIQSGASPETADDTHMTETPPEGVTQYTSFTPSAIGASQFVWADLTTYTGTGNVWIQVKASYA